MQLIQRVRHAMEEGEFQVREPGDRESLISAWIGYAQSSEEDLFWACETLAEVIDDDPAQAFEIVLERRVEGDENPRRALTRPWLSPSDLDPATLDRYRNLGAPPPGGGGNL